MPREISDSSRLKQGRGIIDISNPESYIPWIKARDCYHGDGTRHILPDLFYERRQIHLMSDLEKKLYYMLRGNEKVLDIFEQYPLLPQDKTEEICHLYSIKHPQDPKTKKNIVMTTDFVCIVKDQTDKRQWVACAVKPESQLNDGRVSEKLFIEKQFWKDKNIRWGILTENQVDNVYVNNVILCKNGYKDNKMKNKYDLLKYLIVHKLINVDMHQAIDLDNILVRVLEGEIKIEQNLCNAKRHNNDWFRILESFTEN